MDRSGDGKRLNIILAACPGPFRGDRKPIVRHFTIRPHATAVPVDFYPHVGFLSAFRKLSVLLLHSVLVIANNALHWPARQRSSQFLFVLWKSINFNGPFVATVRFYRESDAMRLFTSDWIIERAVKFEKFPTFEDDTKILVFYIRDR